jgi:hypothetical protein
VRPAFVWALVVVAFPILVLFSVGMVIDDEIEASKRLVIAPTWDRLRRRLQVMALRHFLALEVSDRWRAIFHRTLCERVASDSLR